LRLDHGCERTFSMPVVVEDDVGAGAGKSKADRTPDPDSSPRDEGAPTGEDPGWVGAHRGWPT
jgi:hypothetical protein